MIDIVFPKNKETGFINRARALGYSGLIFVYDEKNASKSKIEALTEKVEDFKIYVAVLVESNPEKFRKFDYLVTKSNNVKVIKQKANLLFDVEEDHDAMHQRRSGLNQVLAKLMKTKKVSYGISFRSILQAKSRSQLIGRVLQNVRLCQKYDVSVVMASFAKTPEQMRSPEDFKSFLRILQVRAPKACFLTQKNL
jgi:RNase P/RNase MRP subunit p30